MKMVGHRWLLLSAILSFSTAYAAEGEGKNENRAIAKAESEAGYAGQETTCKQDSRVRKVKVAYKDEAAGNDCSVTYRKDSEDPGAEKVLWSAQKQPDYCKEKAASFVEKLQGMGWTCE